VQASIALEPEMKTYLLPLATLSMSLAISQAARADDLNDPQIATVALTAHQIDIDRGKMASKKTKNAEVKQFADQMVHDHQDGKAEVLALAKKLNVTPQESAVTKSLKDGAAQSAKKLHGEKGAAFDKDYIDTEVAYHQAVIDAVNKVLIPGAKNAEVKTALQNTVPTLEGHLQHAKNVQAQLGGK
jgi:putative membrane protein